MYIDIDNDHHSYLVFIGRNAFDDHGIEFSIPWFRECPFSPACAPDPYWPNDPACPCCGGETMIPWYRGWLFQLRQWWAYGPGYRIWEWREKRREREQ